MGKKYLVSIIIPVYNVKKYLRQCLESVVQQSFSNIEILLIDDGSTDGSESICEQYASKDRRIVLFHTENRGLAAVRNYGLDHATGDFIAFIDSDDWFELNTIEILIKYALQYDADIVACRCYKEFVDKAISSRKLDDFAVFTNEKALCELICFNNIGQGVWNKLYRRELFEDLRFPVGRLYEDVFLTYRLIANARKIVWLPNMLYHWRMRAKSITHLITLKNYVDRWTAYYNVYEALSNKGELYRKKLISMCISISGRLWLNYSLLSKVADPLDIENVNRTRELMHNFAITHTKEIMYGSYERKVKEYCCICNINNRFYINMLGMVWALRKYIFRDRYLSEHVFYD